MMDAAELGDLSFLVKLVILFNQLEAKSILSAVNLIKSSSDLKVFFF